MRTTSMLLLSLGMIGASLATGDVGTFSPAHQSLIGQLPDAITTDNPVALALNLPSGESITVELQQVLTHDDGSRAWFGRVRGEPFSGLCISLVRGHMLGGLWCHAGTFDIGSPDGAAGDEAQVWVIRERLPDEVVRCAGDPAPRDESLHWPADALATHGRDDANEHAPLNASLPHADSPIRDRGPGSTCTCHDDPHIIDVLCVYTSLARDAAGGFTALQARVQNGLDAATMAIAGSGIAATQMRMTAIAQIDYDEVSPSWNDHLPRLTNPSDGYLDSAQALRDQYQADVVVLIVDDPRFWGGQAYYATFWPQSAFVVINWRGTGGGNLTLAHELGHTFGCAHDRAHADAGVFPFGYGYHFNAGGTEYGTIMSYVGQVIPYYSTPRLSYLGQPVGTPMSDAQPCNNARVIDIARWTVANFRDDARFSDCNGNGIDDAIDIASSTSIDSNGDCRPDECERRFYVDVNATGGVGDGSSWADAMTDLQLALRITSPACSNITQVWVADGTYKPDNGGGDRYARFVMRDGLTIFGGFQGQSRVGGGETSASQRNPTANATILSGAIGNPIDDTDNTITLVEANGTGPTAVLDGFIIEHAQSDFGAAGIWCPNCSSTFRNLVLSDNLATYDGAGMYVDNGGPTIENCRFEYNGALGSGGGLAINYNAATPARVRGCTFVENGASYGGGGINLYLGAADVSDCAFDGNFSQWGGAIGLNQSTLRLDGAVFEANVAFANGGGAIDSWISTSTIANAVFRGNSAVDSGGAMLVNNGSTCTATNITAHGNNTNNSGGNIAVYSSTLNLRNSILWGGTAPSGTTQDRQLYRSGGTVTAAFDCIQGWDGSIGGTANLGSDPRFVAPASGDLRLAAGSPCIDSASNIFAPADALDRDGDGNTSEAEPFDAARAARFVDDPASANSGAADPARPTLPPMDRGAFEYQRPSCPGDVNGDGAVNLVDLATLLANFGVPSGATRSQGDLDGDADIDLTDLATLLAVFGTTCN